MLNTGPPAPAVELAPRPLLQKSPEQTSARVRVELPTDARLFVDGTLMKSTSAVRLFLTPALDSNRACSYELKVELTRNNRTYTEVQRLRSKKWSTVRDDGDWDTRFTWTRPRKGESEISVSWQIPARAAKGEYRILYHGDALVEGRELQTFTGASPAFEVVAPAKPTPAGRTAR